MKAVILAAGRGKRMRPLTLNLPKPLVKVRGKTFLEHILDALPDAVDEVIVVIGYKGVLIKKFLGNAYGDKKIIYAVNDRIATGNARSLLITRKYFKRHERFMIIYGDEPVIKKEVSGCLKSRFSWLTRYYEKPEESAPATLLGDRIIDVKEKPRHPASNFVVGGVMVVSADIFRYKPVKHGNGEYYITSMMKKFIKDHCVISVPGRDNLSFSTAQDVDKYNKSK